MTIVMDMSGTRSSGKREKSRNTMMRCCVRVESAIGTGGGSAGHRAGQAHRISRRAGESGCRGLPEKDVPVPVLKSYRPERLHPEAALPQALSRAPSGCLSGVPPDAL